jgi:hypothetical protein
MNVLRWLMAGGFVVPALLQAQSPKPARITGTVFDSTRSAPLTAASVDVILADDPSRLWRTTTDSNGSFRLDSMSAGRFVVSVTHPRLDSLGVQQLSQGVTLRGGDNERVRLVVPSALTLIRRVCGDTVAAERSGYVRGIMRDAEQGMRPVPGEVQLRWMELSLGEAGMVRSMVSLQARADDEGRFTACGVPVDGSLQVRAWHGGDSTGVLELQVPDNGMLLHDFAVGRSRLVTTVVRDSWVGDPTVGGGARIDSATSVASDTTGFEAVVKRGNATLRATATRADGSPLADARVTMWGTGVEQRTSAAGQYVLPELPTGSHMLDVRAVGFAPVRRVVDVLPGDSTRVSLALDKPVVLNPIRVTSNRPSFGLTQFEQNRKSYGAGRFITPEMLEARPPIRTTDVFRAIPGTRVVPGPFGDRVIMRSMTMASWCTPDLWIDGMRAVNDVPLEMLVSPQDLLAVEVYTGGAALPAQYTGLSGCGAILLYTGVRGKAKR